MRKYTLWILMLLCVTGLCGCGKKEEDTLVLRVCSWEEYIDEGDWDEEDAIELDNGEVIYGENTMVEDFETWYEETYGKKICVEYSTVGTNEDLYNQLTMGDTFDLVCPSEYMLMKLMAEDALVPFSDEFYDTEAEGNYYCRGVSPFIKDVFEGLTINGESLDKYAAGYMWGTLGIVYNPDIISEEDAGSWDLFLNEKYKKKVTIKDSVRDSFVGAIAVYYQELLLSEEFVNAPDYKTRLSELLNDTSGETLDGVEQILSDMKENVYSFETDAGKADLVTGKVAANMQWSGDAVYSIDQIEEEGVELSYSVPKEGANIWFDGWGMLKCGINGDAERQQAAEAFVNFVSRPDNVVRNMDYIGYTSVIAGREDDTVFQYVLYNYAAEEDGYEGSTEEGNVANTDVKAAEEIAEYPLGYFFSPTGNPEDSDFVVFCEQSQTKRQLYAQYPPAEDMERCVVMDYFDPDENERINRMWINIRCMKLW